MNGLFVTATDTGVGKTALAAALASLLRARGLDVGVAKPVATGAAMRSGLLVSLDAQFLKSVSGIDDSIDEICPLLFEMPASPCVAAEDERRPIDLEGMRRALAQLASRHDYLLVEGIGGWRVPITADFTVRELARELALPVLVVARAGLGTVNHSVLTLESIVSAGLRPVGVVLVAGPRDQADPTLESNPRLIQHLTGVPVLGIIPFDPEISVDAGRPGNIVRLVARHVDLKPIVDALTSPGPKRGSARK